MILNPDPICPNMEMWWYHSSNLRVFLTVAPEYFSCFISYPLCSSIRELSLFLHTRRSLLWSNSVCSEWLIYLAEAFCEGDSQNYSQLSGLRSSVNHLWIPSPDPLPPPHTKTWKFLAFLFLLSKRLLWLETSPHYILVCWNACLPAILWARSGQVFLAL